MCAAAVLLLIVLISLTHDHLCDIELKAFIHSACTTPLVSNCCCSFETFSQHLNLSFRQNIIQQHAAFDEMCVDVVRFSCEQRPPPYQKERNIYLINHNVHLTFFSFSLAPPFYEVNEARWHTLELAM